MSYIYVILNPESGLCKIGLSDRPLERLKELQTAHGHPLELIGVTQGDHTKERELRQRYDYLSDGMMGEWLRYDEASLKDLLSECATGSQWSIAERCKWELRVITPNDAQRMVDECEFTGQRRIREEQVEMITREMRNATFLPVESIMLAQTNGHFDLINGQHRARAIYRSGKAQAEWVVVVRNSDPDEAKRLYCACDKNSPRKWPDALHIYGLGDSDLPETWYRKLAPAITFIKGGYRDSTKLRIGDQEMLELTNQYRDAAIEYRQTVLGCPDVIKDAMLRRAVMGVAIDVLRRTHDDQHHARALKFWHLVAMGDEKSGTITRLLHDHLIQTRMMSQGTSKSKPEQAARQARYVIKCWNIFVDGSKTPGKLPTQPDGPIIMKGLDE